jgi:integrase
VKGYMTRKNNNWYVVIYEGLDPTTGKERRRWHPAGTDRTEAEALAQRLSAQTAARGAERSRLTLARHVQQTWMPRKARQLRPVTLDGYLRQLRLYILPALGPIPLRSLRPEAIEALYEHLLTAGRADGTGGLSTKSVLETHVPLRQILDDAVARGLLPANPARQAVTPRHRRDQHRRRMAWTARELSTFLSRVEGHRHHRTWWLAAHTGVRRSELVGLRWRDIDLHRQRLSITRTIVTVNGRMQPSNGKTANAARTIDLDHRTVDVLGRWRNDHADLFGGDDPERGLVVGDDGQPINPQSISQGFDRAVAKTELPKLSLHGLRHTHATLLLKAGVPLKVVSERLGHSTPAFTMATYQHVLPGMQAEAAATFADLLDEPDE